MQQDNFKKLLGEWTGSGEMTVGEHVGKILESIKIENTDISTCYSYIRKSSIDFGQRVTLHNEMGYIKPDGTDLLLSRGSYIIMIWDDATQSYNQTAGSKDSKNMIRKITFNSPAEMTWDNVMDVDHGGNWVSHTANTVFTRIA